MVRPATSDRGNEKFVEWKEHVQSKGDIANVDGHDSTSRVRKKKQATRQNFMLSSFVASIQGPGVEEQGHAISPTAIVTEKGVGTLSPSRAEVHSLAPPPIFNPHRRMQSTRASILPSRSTVFEGAFGQTPDMHPEAFDRRATQRESLQHHYDTAAHGDEGTVGPQQRQTPQGFLRGQHPFGRAVARPPQRALQGQQTLETGTGSQSKGYSSTTARTLPMELDSRTNFGTQLRTKTMQIKEGQRSQRPTTPLRVHSERPQHRPACGTSRSPSVSNGRRRSPSPNTDCGRIPEEYVEGRVQRSHATRQHEPQTYSFYNTDNETDNSDGSEKDYEEEVEEVEEQENEDVEDLVADYVHCETEAEKRKERRRVKWAREREGDRRRREGLPRNYLLVDEYTKKPYGIGVNDWRKEVMLLSRKLDPSIGLINRQPHDAVQEIADWIQHTWEYSIPIKFEVVKEVIARGVSLRRAELWKKIRNNEPKPEDVSDRTWRSLKRELENPATIRKLQNCSKANASRMNFGRTGPSGEVGVRERLRKRLRRSPDPEEIRFEMARDKGYGGRSKRMQNEDNVMHGSQRATPGSFEVARVTDVLGNPYLDKTEVACNPHVTSGLPVQIHDKIGSEARPTTGNIGSGGVHPMSEEQLACNPFVMRLMERIAALEGRQSIIPIEPATATTNNLSTEVTENGVEPVAVAVHTTCMEGHAVEPGPVDDPSRPKQAEDDVGELGSSQAMRRSRRVQKKAKWN